MAFSLVRSLVKNTLKHIGDGLTGGLIPVGSIATGVYEEWRNRETTSPSTGKNQSEPTPAAQLQLRAEFESIVQDCRRYRQQLETILAEMNLKEDVRHHTLAYLNQVPGRIQSSMRRPEDPTGRTVPPNWVLHRAEDLSQFLPEKMPRFQAGDRAVPGTDLILQELLGVGGFGEVWKAVHKSRPHAAPVALKFCTDEAASGSLRKEVELLDRVANQGRHKGIVELKYAHLEGATPCLEYEYVDGGDLAGLISDLHRTARAQPLQIAKIIYGLALSVGFAHRLKPPIVHRDLKPQNILTTRKDGKVQFKVADFGIGGIASDQAIKKWNWETRAGVLSGTKSAGSCTPLYASPQQRRFGPPDPRDDVYAIGVIWYQMLTGDMTKEPPRGGSWKRKLLDHGVTSEMIALLERCIEDDPAERSADAHILAEELSKILLANKSEESRDSAQVVEELRSEQDRKQREKEQAARNQKELAQLPRVLPCADELPPFVESKKVKNWAIASRKRTSRQEEEDEDRASQDFEERSQRKRARARQGISPALLWGLIGGGGLVLMGIIVVVVILLRPSPVSQHEAAMKEAIQLMSDLENALKEVKDQNSARLAASKINQICDSLEALGKKVQALPKISKTEENRLQLKYKNQVDPINQRMFNVGFQAGLNSGGEASFQAATQRLVQVEQALKRMGI